MVIPRPITAKTPISVRAWGDDRPERVVVRVAVEIIGVHLVAELSQDVKPHHLIFRAELIGVVGRLRRGIIFFYHAINEEICNDE